MNELSDQQLLRDYAEPPRAERHRETAFAELVRRHVDLVYSTALRLVRDPHLAEDVTQAVFVALAGHARQLTTHPVLSGWLHCTARNLAAKVVRSEVRRRGREQEAALMNDLLADAEGSWTAIAPHLDAALADLNEADRDALLLRYFEKKSASEMAGILGVSTEAAQRRVSRAVERLRDIFAQRGVTVGAGGLVVLITANAVQAAPIGLAATISGAALAGAALSTSSAIAITKTIAMTTLQKTLIGAVLAAAVGTGFYEARQAAHLREQNQTLQQQQSAQAAQLRQWQHERDEAAGQLLEVQAENARLKTNSQQSELLQLRGEIAQLKTENDDPTQKAAKAMARKVNLLRQRLEETPKWKIPELQFVTEKDWADAAWDANLATDDGVRDALSRLRETAINTFLNEMMKTAVKKYLAANNNVLPAGLAQLKPYFDQPVTDDMLDRYQLLQSGTPDPSATLVRLAVNVDDDYDSNHSMSINGASGGRFNRVQGAVEAAANAYTVDHWGQLPADPSQLSTYLKTPLEVVTIRKYLDQILANPPPPEAATLAPALKAYSDAHNGQMPKNPSDLLPYTSTSEQRTALQKIAGF